MARIDTWLRKCAATDRGRLFLDNLGIDLEFGFLAPEDLKRFCAGLKKARTSKKDTQEAFVQVVEHSVSSEGLYLASRAKSQLRRSLAQVFALDNTMVGHLFNFSSIGGYRDLPGPADHLALIAANGGLRGIIRAGAQLRGRKPFVWLAIEDEVATLIAAATRAGANPADRVRDALGLLHVQADYYLCRIVIPRSEATRLSKRRPSAFDAGPNLVFRALAKPERSGRTIALSTGAESLREVVTDPVLLRASHDLIPIGRIGAASAFSWTDLAASVDSARVIRTSDAIQAAGT